ncbi:MAG: alpha-amylase family glycosyl hydrolase [Clostridium fessum]
MRNYLLDTVRFWVQEFDIDGIRLDCAGDLSFEFMQELRRLANEIKPEFWLMGEVIHGEYARWVNPQMLHSVTNYEMHKSIYSAHNDHNYFELAHNVRRLEAVGRDLYTFVDNHDEDRIASKLLNPAHLAPLYTLLFTLPGIPSIYYGSEWGIQGRRGHNSDTELRPRILPPRPLAEEMQTSDGQNAGTVTPLTLLIQKLAAIHAAEPALHGGRYQELLLTNRQYAFARHGDHQAILTAANNDDNAAYLQVPLPFHTTAEQATDLITGKSFLIDKNTNKIQIELEGNSAVILGITEG